MGEVGSFSFNSAVPGQLAAVHWKTTYPRVYWQHRLDSVVLKSGGNTKLGELKESMDLGGVGDGDKCDESTLYEILKKLILKIRKKKNNEKL